MMAIFSRLFSVLAIVVAIFALTRATVRALPGDPLETLIAETGTSIPRELLREEFHLDQPFVLATWTELKGAVRGDFGRSLLSREKIGPLLAKRFENTIVLTLISLLFGVPISLLLGLAAAARGGGWADRICSLQGAISAALPTPWAGPMLIILFALLIPIFPIGGHVVLPALTLALGFSGLWARLIRERVRESLLTGSAPGARARGIPEWKVLLKYGLAPASGALIAYLGTQVGGLLAGAFVTEVIFDWKGIGTLLVDAVLRRDYPVVESATFVSATACLAGNLLGDFAQELFEPRKPLL